MGVGHTLDGGPCCGLCPPSADGLVWPAPLSHLPTLQRFGVQGESLYLRRGLRPPLHPALGGRRGRCFVTWRVGMPPDLPRGGMGTLPNLPPSTRAGTEAPRGVGVGMGPLRSAIQRGHGAVIPQSSAVIAPTAVRPRCDGLFLAGAALRRFSEQGDTLHPRRGLRALHAAWGNEGFVVAYALLQRGDWLGLRRCPTWPALQRFWKQGDSLYPRRGLRALHLLGGNEGFVVAYALLQRGDWLGLRRCPTWPTLQRFWEQGDSLYPRRGRSPLHPAWGERGFCCGLRPPSAGGWLGVRRCPTCPPSNVFGNRGTRCTPGGGATPCTLLGEIGGTVVHLGAREEGDAS